MQRHNPSFGIYDEDDIVRYHRRRGRTAELITDVGVQKRRDCVTYQLRPETIEKGVKMVTVKIKYFDDELESITKIKEGDWIDLRAAETVVIDEGEYKLISLGIGMILPDGYEAHVLPRSSTPVSFGIMMANSMGVIDNSYSGDDDVWHFPALAIRSTTIHKGDKIAQFRLVKNQPLISFDVVNNLNDESRGGIGSTGKR